MRDPRKGELVVREGERSISHCISFCFSYLTKHMCALDNLLSGEWIMVLTCLNKVQGTIYSGIGRHEYLSGWMGMLYDCT